MAWHYILDGRSLGPVAEEVFRNLCREGIVRDQTWVWHAGMPDWRLLGEMDRPGEGAFSPVLGCCAQCGRLAPTGELLAFERAWVCGSCKPVVLTRLKEGLSAVTTQAYGGFWIRALAAATDWVLLASVSSLVLLPVMYMSSLEQTVLKVLGFALLTLIPYGIKALYEIFMVGRYGATLGKMICRLRVVLPDGSPVTYARSAGRHFAKYLSGLTLIGYLLAAVGEEKKALHDMICDTRVMRF